MKLKELAELTGAKLVGDPNFTITGVADLKSATPSDISFLAINPFGNVSYASAVKKTQAGAIFLPPEIDQIEGKNYLITDNPSQAFQQIVEIFYPKIPSGFTDIHPSAVIHDSAKIAKGVTIGNGETDIPSDYEQNPVGRCPWFETWNFFLLFWRFIN